MNKRDYYEVLDLVPNCTIKDVKKNYHKLALVWHPDKHIDKGEAQSKFTEIHEAYSVLGDANKRKIYDTKGHKGLIEDQEIADYTSCHVKNLFCQKGFNGTDKSAFDVLKNIFEESDADDDFFKSCNMFKCPDAFKSNLESFFDENKILSENEDAESFFKGYTPTFMDTNFFQSSASFFSTAFPEEDCISQTEFFSFFTSGNSGMQGFSRTSSKVCDKKKSKKCPKQTGKAEKAPKKCNSREELCTEFFTCSSPDKNLNCKRSCNFVAEACLDTIFSLVDEDDDDDCDDFFADMQAIEESLLFSLKKGNREKKKPYKSVNLKCQDVNNDILGKNELKSRKKMRSQTYI